MTRSEAILDELERQLTRSVAQKPAPKTRRLKEAPIRRSFFWRGKSKKAQAPPDDDKPKLFSEKHPNAFKASRAILPRLPAIILVSWIVYAMLANLWRGDYLFLLRWYRQSWILPRLVHVLSSKQAFIEWWNIWGPFTVMTICAAVFVGVVLYLFVWRFFFKDYIRYSEGVETKEGRCYWVEGSGMLFNLWDMLYYRRKTWPLRKKQVVYLNTRWLPPNPVSPTRKLLKIELDLDEGDKLERRGPYELVGHEAPYRRIVGIRQFKTHKEAYRSDPIRLQEASQEFARRTSALVRDTQTLSKANVDVRLEKMKSGTVIIDEELREMILHERGAQKT